MSDTQSQKIKDIMNAVFDLRVEGSETEWTVSLFRIIAQISKHAVDREDTDEAFYVREVLTNSFNREGEKSPCLLTITHDIKAIAEKAVSMGFTEIAEGDLYAVETDRQFYLKQLKECLVSDTSVDTEEEQDDNTPNTTH